MSLAKRAIFPERNSRQNAIKTHSFPHFPRRKKAFLHLLLNIQETATARPTANNEIEASLPNAYIQQRVAEQGTDALVRFPVDTHRRRNKKKVIRARILLIQLSQKERSAWIKGSRGVSVKEIPAKQTALIATRWHEADCRPKYRKERPCTKYSSDIPVPKNELSHKDSRLSRSRST